MSNDTNKKIKVLYLSSLMTKRRRQRVFKKYGKLSSYAAQKYHQMVVDGLKANGMKVEALSTYEITREIDSRWLHRAKREVENGIRYSYIPRINIPILGNIIMILIAAYNINCWCRKNKNGIIICDQIVSEFSLALKYFSIYKNKKIVIVTDVYGKRADNGTDWFHEKLDKLRSKVVESFDGFIFLTKQMNDLYNKSNKPYTVIEGFVDKNISNIDNDFSKKYKTNVCMFAGMLEPVFGIDTLVKAFQNPILREYELKLFGYGTYVKNLKEIEKNYKNIHYCGELENEDIVLEEMKATLLINPRNNEGEFTQYSFPSKDLEYIASGTPLVGYFLDGMPSEYEGHYYKLEAQDADEMAEEILNYFEIGKENIHAFGTKAKQWIYKEKNNIKQCQKIIKIIRELEKC